MANVKFIFICAFFLTFLSNVQGLSVSFVSPSPSNLEVDSCNVDNSCQFTVNASLASVSTLGNVRWCIGQGTNSCTNNTMYASDLMGFWGFNSISAIGDSSTVAKDQGIYGRDGTISSASYVTGKFGKALSFTGGSSSAAPSVLLSSNAMFNGAVPFSTSFWINNIGSYNIAKTQYMSIIGTRDDTNTYNDWALVLYSDRRLLLLYKYNFIWVSTSSLPSNTWSHILMTVNSSNFITTYVNGIKDNSLTFTPTTLGTKTLKIGKGYDVGWGNWVGLNATLDEVMYWNRSFSDAEALQLYNLNLYKSGSSNWVFASYQKNLSFGSGAQNYTYSVYASDAGGWSNGGMRIVAFSNATITTTTTTSSTSTTITDSYIQSVNGGIKILPGNNKIVVNTTGLTMMRPDGQLVCCGPNNSNNWACSSGSC